MKIILSLAALLLLTYLNGTIGQSQADKNLENFLNSSLNNFPNWLKDNNHVPLPIERESEGLFTFNSTRKDGTPAYHIDGGIRNRRYHGAENNISATDIQSNVSSSTFEITFSYGNATTDFVEAEYGLYGFHDEVVELIGDGMIRHINRSPRLYLNVQCKFDVEPTGYIWMRTCSGWGNTPKFYNFTMTGFEHPQYREIMTGLLHSWYDMQFPDFMPTFSYYLKYMREIFAKTPVDEIIGVKLAPTTITAKSIGNEEKIPVYKSESYFDLVTGQMMQKSSMKLQSK